MEDLKTDDVLQIANFYRQKASELELQVLQLQLQINKLMAEKQESNPTTNTAKSDS